MLSLKSKDAKTWDFDQTIEIGRAADNAIRIQDPTVGAKHARVIVEVERVLLLDLDSTNGTWAGGLRLTPGQPHPLKHGDSVRLGSYELTFWGAMKTQIMPEPVDPTVRMPAAPAQAPAPQAPVVPPAERTVMRANATPYALVRADGTEQPLEGTLTVGRKPYNGLQLGGDPKVSETHSRLEVKGDAVFINDAGSSNGTWVNGRRINGPTRLAHGDSILIGDTKFRLRVAGRPFTRQPARSGLNPVWGAAAALAVLALAGLGWTLTNRGTPAPSTQAQAAAQVLATTTAPAVTPRPVEVETAAPATAEGLERARRATVLITANGLAVEPTTRQIRGLVGSSGSGVFVDAQRRYVLTAWHVISSQVYARLLIDCSRRYQERWRTTSSQYFPIRNSLTVKFNGDDPSGAPNRLYKAELVGYETINLDRFCLQGAGIFSPANDQFLSYLESFDVALIRVSEVITGVTEGQLPATRPLTSADTDFTAVRSGNSDRIQGGSPVTVLGFPEGTSLMKRSQDEVTGVDIDRGDGIDSERDWFTTDTPIRPGNSGGPVLDETGSLIGIALQLRTGSPSIAQSTGYVRPLNTILMSPAITRYWNPGK